MSKYSLSDEFGHIRVCLNSSKHISVNSQHHWDSGVTSKICSPPNGKIFMCLLFIYYQLKNSLLIFLDWKFTMNVWNENSWEADIFIVSMRNFA